MVEPGFGLSGWERWLAGAALVGCLLGIYLGGRWSWVALPCIATLFLLTLRRTGRTDRALAQSQVDYRELVDLPAQATFIADPSGTLLHVSRRLREWTGHSFAETARRDWIEAVHPDDRERSAAAWVDSIETGQPFDVEYRLLTKSGQWRWFRARAFPQRSADGAITRWVGAVEDIHDSRLAEEQLRQTAGLLEMIGSSTESIIWAKDRDGRMLYINSALERLAGVKLADVLGKLDIEWNPNRAEVMAFSEADRRVLDSGIADDCEERFTGRGGEPRLYRSVRSPLRDRAGAVIGSVGIATDITERHEAEERERLLARELDHRAKNLLAVVQSVVSLTRADTLAEFKKAVEGRIQSLGRAHSMLAASRWDGADLERVLAEELAPYCGGDEARAQLSGPALLLKPSAAQSLALVFHELATNAVKYGALSVPAGTVHVRWEVVQGADCRPLLSLVWEERDGPPVKPRPTSGRSGFGSRLIRSSIERQLAGSLHLDWAPGGLVAKIEVALDRSLQEPGGGGGPAPTGDADPPGGTRAVA